MAGSYNHIVEEDGRLSNSETINGMLECMSGDVVECVTEMYGMIWWLAEQLAQSYWPTSLTRAEVQEMIVKEAQSNYQIGLAVSPGIVEED